MRYVSSSQLKKDMILGQDIHDASGRMLLAKQTAFTQETIAYLNFLGVPGVYIDDADTSDIEVKNVVRPDVKQTALTICQDMFQSSAEGQIDVTEQEIRKMVEGIVEDVLENAHVMYNLMEVRTYDDYTYFHSVTTAILAGIIGAKCKLSKNEIEDVVTAGFLHDIGKVFIDKSVLNAPRKLTESERIRMMEHPRVGYDHLKKYYSFNNDVLTAVLQHHEWYNGNGYPNHVNYKKTSKASRILKAADVYDAMTSKRPYHEPYLPGDVLEYIMGRCGTEFDPTIVKIMTAELGVYPVGCEVELSDGSRGIVVENHRGFVLRPTVKLKDSNKTLNLLEDPGARKITITKLVL